MRTQVSANPEPEPIWAGITAGREQHIDVTVTTPPDSDQGERLREALARVNGVLHVETPAPAQSPGVPREMQAFANRLWEIL